MAPRNAEIDDYEDERPRKGKKRRKKQSSSNTTTMLIVIGVGCGVFLFCCIPGMLAALLPAVQQGRDAARRTQERNQLKQIGLATLNFHDVFLKLPSQNVLEPGAVRQSWMTDLLPYIDQAGLYPAINRKVAWNDASNQGPLSTRVPTYISPTLKDVTDPATGYALAHFAGNVHLLGRDPPIGLSEITDGTSNTMLAGSVMNGLKPWGDPENRRDPANGVGIGTNQFLRSSFEPRGAFVLMADGSVRYVNESVSPNIMPALAKPDDNLLPPADFK